MRVAIGMKSNFAFDRLITTFSKQEKFSKIQAYEVNIQTIHKLDDAIEFYKPELIILDSMLSDINNMVLFVKSNQIGLLHFESDIEGLLNDLAAYLPGEEQNEDSLEPQSENHQVAKELPPLTQTVYKEKIIEKEIIKTSYTAIPNKIIVVASMWNGAGSTTFSVNLARAIAERGVKVSYVEFPLSKPYMFDYLHIPRKEVERKRDYINPFKELNNNKFWKRNEVWTEEGIDWYVQDTREEPVESLSYESFMRFLYKVNTTITIIDVSANLHKQEVRELLHYADEILICVEPDPIKIDWLSTINNQGKDAALQRIEKQNIDYLNMIEGVEGVSYQFVNMKFSKRIDVVSWLKCLEKKPICFFPSYHYDDMIKAVWDSAFLYDSDDLKDDLDKVLKPVITRVLPRQFYDLPRDKKSILGSLFKGLKKESKS
ncbi:hypothetical protein KM915_20855 [Cytobacillus oceanisediminis]|uniref:hypothetical protein n=1 Tax=Cytobacillus oceanisediminis TaxID=665099 RepID=UPI001C210122|nr:hypothetical protein [Cytobacillus oceanisediminis]MBU8732501.1 hypothetical protein [Cytobacillus oceanisediminis]